MTSPHDHEQWLRDHDTAIATIDRLHRQTSERLEEIAALVGRIGVQTDANAAAIAALVEAMADHNRNHPEPGSPL